MASSPFNPIHISYPVTTKLTRNNFSIWKAQITCILHSHGLLNFLESSPPIKYLHPTYLLQINPAYESWCSQDQVILLWLRSSLSDTILGQVASCTTSRKLLTSLQAVTSPSPLSQSIRSSSHRSVTSSSLQSQSTRSSSHRSVTSSSHPTQSIRSSSHRSVTSSSNPTQSIRSSSIRSVTSPSGQRYTQQVQSQPSVTQNPLTQRSTLTLQPLQELLKEKDLPPGLFPKNITGYNFDGNTNKITVNMPRVLNVSNLQFSKTVTGSLEKGRLYDINGIKTETLIMEGVRCIERKTIDGKLFLDLSLISNGHKRRPFKEFTALKDGIP